MDTEKYEAVFSEAEKESLLHAAYDALNEYIYNSCDTTGWRDYIEASLILLEKFGRHEEAAKYRKDAEEAFREEREDEKDGF